MGHGLIARLAAAEPERPIITARPEAASRRPCSARAPTVHGSISSKELLASIQTEYAVDRVYHLAALLSTRSEFSPELAHKVNVEGALNVLEFTQRQGESHGRLVSSLSLQHCGLRASLDRGEGGRGQGEGRRVQPADDDVWGEQAVL